MIYAAFMDSQSRHQSFAGMYSCAGVRAYSMIADLYTTGANKYRRPIQTNNMLMKASHVR